MQEIQYQRGDVLYREGDRSNAVFRIVAGSVELSRTVDGAVQAVGTAAAGEIFGDVATLVDRNRTNTVRAREDGTVVQRFDLEEFLREVAGDPDSAYSLLWRVSDMLRASRRRASDFPSLRLVEGANGQNRGAAQVEKSLAQGADTSLTIFAEAGSLEAQIPKDGVVAMASPFLVGRKPEDSEVERSKGVRERVSRPPHTEDRRSQADRRQNTVVDPSTGLPKVHLQLIDQKPFRLSRIHFAIQKTPDGGHIIRDLGSYLGTQVNDTYLGRDFPNDYVELAEGDNSVIAGGEGSPFRFRVAVQSVKP